jgi:hypothetical protein
VSGDLQPVFLAGATVEEVQKKDGSGSFFKISVGDRSIILNKPDVEFKEVRGGVNVTPTAYDKCQWKANAKPWSETLPPAGVRLPDRQKRKLDQAEEAAQLPAFEPADTAALRSALVESLGTEEELHRRCEAYLAEHPNLRGLVTDDAVLTLLAKDLAIGVATRRSTTPAAGKRGALTTTQETTTSALPPIAHVRFTAGEGVIEVAVGKGGCVAIKPAAYDHRLAYYEDGSVLDIYPRAIVACMHKETTTKEALK